MLKIVEYQEKYVKEMYDLIIRNLTEINSKDYSVEEINGFIKDFDVNSLRNTLKNREKVYVAIINDEVVGTAGIAQSWYKDDEYLILTVFVRPDYHGQGIGKSLVEKVEEFARTLPITKLIVPASITAHKFYYKLGYRYENGKEDLNNEGMYIMEKTLNNFDIRKANHSDCPKLSLLKREIWETTYRGIYPDEKIDNYNYNENTERFKRFVDSDSQQLYVVTHNDEIIGYIEFGEPFRPYKNYKQEIGLFYIKLNFQRHGIGKKLFSLAFNYIKSTGTDSFFVSCHKYNLNAQGFYEKMGGKVIHVDDDSANNGIPQIKYEFLIK